MGRRIEAKRREIGLIAITMWLALAATTWSFGQVNSDEAPDDKDPASEPRISVTIRATETERAEAARAITELRLPGIDRTEPERSLDALLGQVPGVELNARFSPSLGDRILIRGSGARAAFGTRGVKVLLDGIPLTTPDGTSQLNNVDPAMLNRMEVMRGPASSLHGNASGGVIALYTGDTTNAPRWVEVSARTAAWDGQSSQLRGGGRHGDLRFQVGVSALREDGFRDHAAAAEERVLFTGQYALRGDLELNWVAHHTNAPYLQAPGSLNRDDASNQPRSSPFSAVLFGTAKRVDQNLAGISVRHMRGSGVWSVSLYGANRDLDNAIVRRWIELDRQYGGLRAHWNGTGFGLAWKIGLDLEHQRDDRREFALGTLPSEQRGVLSPRQELAVLPIGDVRENQLEKVANIAPYFEVRRDLGGNRALTGGLRYDQSRFKVDSRLASIPNARRTFRQVSGFIGFTWQQNGSLWYANVASAFETPTANELGNLPEGFDSNALQPETTRGIEIGGRGTRGAWTWEGAIYASETRRLIVPFTPESGGATFFANAASARNLGVEARLTHRWQGWLETALIGASQNFRFRGNFANPFASGRVDVDNKRVPAVTPNQIRLDVRGKLSSAWQTQLRWQWRDRTWGNNLNGPEDDGALDESFYRSVPTNLVGLRASYQTSFSPLKLKLHAGIDNLFDRRADSSIVPNAFDNRYFEPAPDRTYFGGLTLRWSP